MTPFTDIVLLVQLVATGIMVGVIWIVQLLVYPTFIDVAAGAERHEWRAFHARHSRRISLVVGPVMVVEAVCALWLLVVLPAALPAAVIAVGAGLVAMLWATTILVSTRHHARLSIDGDVACIRRLIRVNWVRTAAWSLRGVLAFILCVAV